MRTLWRVVAGLAAVAMVPIVLFGIYLLTFAADVSLQTPRRDSCNAGKDCQYWGPRTSAELREGIAGIFAIAVIDALIAAAAVAALWWAATGRPPRWRRLALIPAGAVVIVAILTEPWWTA